jgi:hypothetical protein
MSTKSSRDEQILMELMGIPFNVVEVSETHDKALPTSLDPLDDILQAVAQKPQYAGEEQGIYHPQHQQTLKMRNNQMMDHFVDHDCGFRYDPKTNTINAHADHFKKHIGHLTMWATGNVTHWIKGSHQAKIYGTMKHEVFKDIVTVTHGNLSVTVDKNENVTIKGNANIHVHGDAKINVDGDYSLYARGNIDIDAGGKIYIG